MRLAITSEFRSTAMHASFACNFTRLYNVKVEGENYFLRGKKWCPTCKCFVDRDFNGATNIAVHLLYPGDKKPVMLRRKDEPGGENLQGRAAKVYYICISSLFTTNWYF